MQCYHQFTPLSELHKLGTERKVELFRKYCAYTAHISRTVYHDPEQWEQQRQQTETDWPEYRTSTLALSRPAYQSADGSTMDGPTWRRLFLEKDVEALQQLKQHHVHLPKTENGPRLPLEHCRDKKDPSKCKAGFPREHRLVDKPVLVCKGLATQMEMPPKGKRSALGQLWGPCNDPNLNGNHPAMLAALRCNGDVQVPYRFPIIEELHEACGRCALECASQQDLSEISRQAQVNQAAQAGYACDYQNKRLPIAVHEVQEWQKSHKELETELQDNPHGGYVGARASKRLMTQCFARGVCRGAVECVNLVDHLEHSDPTAAEAIKTGQVTEMSLHFGLQLLRAATRGEPLPPEREKIQTDTIAKDVNKKPIARPQLWTLYGNRGKDPRVEHLSAYEFARYYHDKESRYPWTLKKHQEQLRQDAAAAVAETSSSTPSARTPSPKFHARLTDSGRQKLENKVSRTRLQPGEDYRIQEEGGEDWMPLGTGSLVQTYRHNWIIAPRKRPHVPVLFGALGSRNEEENIMKILLLFCPWTSNPQDATDSVPYLSQLKTPDTANWRQALRCAWQNANDGFPTEELRRYVLNYAFVYCLPRQLQPDNDLAANSDNEGLEDVVCHFNKEDLEEAAKTRVRGAGTKEEAAEANDTGPAEQATAATSTQHDLTVRVMKLSRDIWLAERPTAAAAPQRAAEATHSRMVRSQKVTDPEKMLLAARASRNQRGAELAEARAGLDGGSHRPAARPMRLVTEALLQRWLNSEEIRSSLNAEQHEFLKLVVERVLVEYHLVDPRSISRKTREPLVWLLHGSPGTGKSHVLKYLRMLLQDVLGYVQGIDFEVTAFQATNAADVGGLTLHTACGLNREKDCLDTACRPDTARRIAFWRWLFIDEVGMVSARLLAQVDLRIRGAVPAAAQWKYNDAGTVRPFAGLNVLLSGDFRQLPPPEGGFLADLPEWMLPSSRAPGSDALVDHGQSIIWQIGVQGITELFQRERCKDDWWNEAGQDFKRN